MSHKRSSSKASATAKQLGKKEAPQAPIGERRDVPSPLTPRDKAVIVKDLLGSFSEQTGASFG